MRVLALVGVAVCVFVYLIVIDLADDTLRAAENDCTEELGGLFVMAFFETHTAAHVQRTTAARRERSEGRAA